MLLTLKRSRHVTLPNDDSSDDDLHVAPWCSRWFISLSNQSSRRRVVANFALQTVCHRRDLSSTSWLCIPKYSSIQNSLFLNVACYIPSSYRPGHPLKSQSLNIKSSFPSYKLWIYIMTQLSDFPCHSSVYPHAQRLSMVKLCQYRRVWRNPISNERGWWRA